MSTLQDSDLFIVDRNGTNYQLPNSQMSTLQDTDLFVVERSGVNYKIEAKDVSTGSTGSIETPVAVLTPLNGAGTNAGQPYQPLSTAITAVGAGGETVYATDTIANVQNQVLFDGVVTGNVSQDLFSTSSSYGGYNPGWKGAFSGVIDDPYNCASAGGSDSGSSTFTFTFDVPIISGDVIRVGIDTRRTDNGIVLTFSGGSTVSLYSNTSGLVSLGGGLFEYDLSAFAGENLVSFNVANVIGYYSGVVAIKSEGFWLTENVVNSVEALAFPTDNNFDKFEVGDVVQTTEDYLSVFYGTNNAGAYSTANVSNPENAFNGSESSEPVTINDSDSGASLKVLELRLSEMPTNPYSNGSFVVEVQGYDGSNISLNGATSGKYYVSGVNNTTFPAITALSTIRIQRTDAGQCGLFYIKVNGVILTQVDPVLITGIDDTVPRIMVDGGSWYGQDGSGDAGNPAWSYPSQMWSNRLTSDVDVTTQPSYSGPGGFPPGYPRTNAFNGQPGTTAGTTYSSGNPGGDPNRRGIITFDARGLGINVTTDVFVWSNAGPGGPATVTVTTTDGSFSGTNALTADSSGVSLPCTGTLIMVTAENQDPNFRGIKIDGLVLVNSSVPGGRGATDITKTVSSDASLTFTSDLELANMVGPLSQVDENGDVKVPVTSTIASVDEKSITFTAAGSPTIGTLADATDDDLATYANFDQSSQFKITANIDNVIKLGFISSNPNNNVRLYVNISDNKGLETNRIDYGGGLFIQEWVFPEQSLSEFKFSTAHLSGGSNFRINNVLVNGLSLNNQGSTLTFNTPNPDLQYFQPGDNVGTSSGFAPVLYTGNGSTQSIDWCWV